jgi:hypothetical protein
MNDIVSLSNTDLSFVSEQKIQTVEKEFLKQEQVDCPVVHRFGPGIYIREVTLPAGCFSIGHYQKTEHLNIMLTGKVIMVKDDGTHVELEAPQTFISKPGRKIGYIIDTVVWQNVYATDETDVEKLEEMFLEKSITWKEHQEAEKLLLTFNNKDDIDDYYDVLESFGFTEEVVREQTENLEDQIPMPFGNYKFMIGESFIQGKGVLASGIVSVTGTGLPGGADGAQSSVTEYTVDASHNHTLSGTTASAGSSGTNANLQPYITVYMWKRTA